MNNDRAFNLLRQILHPDTEPKDALAVVDELSEGLKKRFTVPKTLADIEDNAFYGAEGMIFIDADGDELILVRILRTEQMAIFLWNADYGAGRSLMYHKSEWDTFRYTGRRADLAGVIENGVGN